MSLIESTLAKTNGIGLTRIPLLFKKYIVCFLHVRLMHLSMYTVQFTSDRIFVHSKILPWNRKSYLTHAILPRLSMRATYIYSGCIGTHAHDVIVMLK